MRIFPYISNMLNISQKRIIFKEKKTLCIQIQSVFFGIGKQVMPEK